MAGKRAVKLKNAEDVTRLLARTINALLRDEIGENKAAKVGYLSNIFLRALESSALESRLEALEKRMLEEAVK